MKYDHSVTKQGEYVFCVNYTKLTVSHPGPLCALRPWQVEVLFTCESTGYGPGQISTCVFSVEFIIIYLTKTVTDI